VLVLWCGWWAGHFPPAAEQRLGDRTGELGDRNRGHGDRTGEHGDWNSDFGDRKRGHGGGGRFGTLVCVRD
jgi:hypothetical protein